jgi:hypothetical protein
VSGGMDIAIEVSISDYPSGGTMRLSERVTVHRGDFGVMAEILARFHEAIQAVKSAKDAPHEP